MQADLCCQRFQRITRKIDLLKKYVYSCPRLLLVSHTFTILATIHHDSSRFELVGKIGAHLDGKKRKCNINTVSHDAPMVSARFINGSTTTHDSSTTIHHGGATNAQECSRCVHDSIRC